MLQFREKKGLQEISKLVSLFLFPNLDKRGVIKQKRYLKSYNGQDALEKQARIVFNRVKRDGEFAG